MPTAQKVDRIAAWIHLIHVPVAEPFVVEDKLETKTTETTTKKKERKKERKKGRKEGRKKRKGIKYPSNPYKLKLQ